MATLYIFSGLPGSGKTTLAIQLAKELKATFLRIDTVEQALRELCQLDVEGEGYRLAYRVAADNLLVQNDVVADSCNPAELTRREWEQVANVSKSKLLNIEISCTDPIEHRNRIETRESTIPGLSLPSWQDVLDRDYHPWTRPVIRIDTAQKAISTCFEELMDKIRKQDP